MIISSFIYVAANSIISFFMAEQYSMVHVHHISLSVHLSIDIQVVSSISLKVILTGLHTTQKWTQSIKRPKRKCWEYESFKRKSSEAGSYWITTLIQNIDNTNSWQGDRLLESICFTADGNIKRFSYLESCSTDSKQLSIHLPFDWAIPIPGIYLN